MRVGPKPLWMGLPKDPLMELPHAPPMGLHLVPTTMRVGPKRLWTGLPKDPLMELPKDPLMGFHLRSRRQ